MTPEILCRMLISIYGKDRIKKHSNFNGKLEYIFIIINNKRTIDIPLTNLKNCSYTKTATIKKNTVKKYFKNLDELFDQLIPEIESLL